MDRTRAWRLLDGNVVGECSLAEAATAAKALGLDVPKSIFSLNEDGIARLKTNLHQPYQINTIADDATIDGGAEIERKNNHAYEALLLDNSPRPDLEAIRDDSVANVVQKLVPRPLVVHSTQPVVSSAICDHIVRECEDRANRLGGWTTQRHENYPTTDVSYQINESWYLKCSRYKCAVTLLYIPLPARHNRCH